MAKKITKDIAKKTHAAATQLELELVQYKLGNKSINFNLDIDHETFWAKSDQISALFQCEESIINNHITDIINEDELKENLVVKKLSDNSYGEKIYYNLDMILSVGYRVSSPKATEFRKWATSTIRSYIVDGYAINKVRLRDDPESLRKLANKIRELRANERNIYESVRSVFKISATDYDSKSKINGKFFALLQNKFHFAVHQNTASELIISRADHKKPNMGLVHFSGNRPNANEITIGKNYLSSDELYILHILCEQFLLFIESSSIRGRKFTMEELLQKLDKQLSMNEYPVFKGYKRALKDDAVKHAQVEYALWLRRLEVEDAAEGIV